MKLLQKLFHKKENELEETLHLETSKQIERAERKYLQYNSNQIYTDFCISETGYPKFISAYHQDGKKNCHTFVPFTPKLLNHCVMNLTKKAKDKEAQDIELFVHKCNIIKSMNDYPTVDWDETIKDLTNYLIYFHTSHTLDNNKK